MHQISIDCDAHKSYSQVEVQALNGQILNRLRIDHTPGAIRTFIGCFPHGAPVALESVGNWYWIADEIEAAGCLPLLTHPAKAKRMMGHINKTDKLDANGLANPLRIGSLPTVWLPPADIRDDRDLPRTRMALCRMGTSLKNRLHSILAKYALSIEDGSELFSQKGRAWLYSTISRIPPETGRCLSQHLELLDSFILQISDPEKRIRIKIALTPSMQLLKNPSRRGRYSFHCHRSGGRNHLPLPFGAAVQ